MKTTGGNSSVNLTDIITNNNQNQRLDSDSIEAKGLNGKKVKRAKGKKYSLKSKLIGKKISRIEVVKTSMLTIRNKRIIYWRKSRPVKRNYAHNSQ